MKQRLLVVVFIAVILALSMLGCVGTESADTSREASEIEKPIVERLADCLAEMFPQMSRSELERQAQMQITDAGEIKNAEAFVEKFCANGEGASQLVPTDTVIPTSDVSASTNPVKPDSVRGLGVTRAEGEGASQLVPTDTVIPTSDVSASTNPVKPDSVRGLGVTRAEGEGASQLVPTDTVIPTSDVSASTNPVKLDSVRGLGVTRAEMEEFFRTEIAANRTVTITAAHRAGGNQITEAHWGGWGATGRRGYGGTYAALSGPDEDLHGILFAYDGKPRNAATKFAAVAGKVRPEESSNRPKHALWVGQRVRGMTFGGGGGLSNIMPSSRSHSAPSSIEESCEIERNRFVQDGIEICVTGRSVGIHGIVIMVIKAPVDDAIAK